MEIYDPWKLIGASEQRRNSVGGESEGIFPGRALIGCENVFCDQLLADGA